MTKLLLDEYPLLVLPSLACAIGLNEAIILQQIHYWLERSGNKHDGRCWIYNSYEGWQEQFPFWSIPTIRRALANLSKPCTPKEGGSRQAHGPLVLVDRFNRLAIDRTLWYSIDYDELERLEGMIRPCDQIDQMDRSKRSDGSDHSDQTITRDYTETTAENEDAALGLGDDQMAAFDALIGLRVEPSTARALAEICQAEQVIGWADYGRQAPGLKSPAALVVARLRAGEPAPKRNQKSKSGADDFVCKRCSCSPCHCEEWGLLDDAEKVN